MIPHLNDAMPWSISYTVFINHIIERTGRDGGRRGLEFKSSHNVINANQVQD